jgi:hypothetical protein
LTKSGTLPAITRSLPRKSPTFPETQRLCHQSQLLSRKNKDFHTNVRLQHCIAGNFYNSPGCKDFIVVDTCQTLMPHLKNCLQVKNSSPIQWSILLMKISSNKYFYVENPPYPPYPPTIWKWAFARPIFDLTKHTIRINRVYCYKYKMDPAVKAKETKRNFVKQYWPKCFLEA